MIYIYHKSSGRLATSGVPTIDAWINWQLSYLMPNGRWYGRDDYTITNQPK